MRYLDGPRPRLFGHRGASGVAPENTLTSFQLALASGADRLELDVHATREGEVVVLHDPTVDRTTNGAGEVRALSFDELRRLDAGAPGIRVPTLAEVLESFPGVPLNIEIKQETPPIVPSVLAVIDRFDARGQVLLAAEGDAIMQRIRAEAPGVLTGFTAFEVMMFLQGMGDPAYRPPGFALQVPPSFQGIAVITSETVARAHALGLEVHAWTINDALEVERLLDLGVDGVMTDLPAMAKPVFARHAARG
jgi:glycerophosphoryl diester phosphodiesterase